MADFRPCYTHGLFSFSSGDNRGIFKIDQTCAIRISKAISNYLHFLVLVFSSILYSGKLVSDSVCFFTTIFSVYSYTELRRKFCQPRNPDSKALLKVMTESNVDWVVTNFQNQIVVFGRGSGDFYLPSTGAHVERETKIKYSEYVYVVEVISGNGDAFVSLTVDENDELLQTVACGRSGESEVVYTQLITGYGTRHWLIPRFLQGVPNVI